MATIIIKLEVDPVTHKKNVWIKYESDSDALPFEHEQAHKDLVNKLIAGGVVNAEDMGTINITREGEITVVAQPEHKEEPRAIPVAVKG